MSGEQAELDEMIAAAAGAELRPGPVFVLFGHRADIPIRIQHLVLPAVLEAGAHAKTRLGLDRPGEPILVPFQFARRNIEHGHLHAAGNIHADRIRNDRVLRGQHSADGQPVANVRIRHEGAGHRDRQQAGFLHLHHRFVLQSFAPLPVFDGLGAWRRWSIQQRLGQFSPQAVLRKSGRVGNDGLHFLFQSRLVPTCEDEFADEIRRPPGGFTQRDAETDKIFRVHN